MFFTFFSNCPLELAYPVMRLAYRSLQSSLKNEGSLFLSMSITLSYHYILICFFCHHLSCFFLFISLFLLSSSTEMFDFSSFRQNVLHQLKDTFSELDSNSPLRPSINLHATNVSSIKHRGARMEDNFIFVPNLWDLVDAVSSSLYYRNCAVCCGGRLILTLSPHPCLSYSAASSAS